MRKKFEKDGFVHIENFLKKIEVEEISEIVNKCHENWIVDNYSFYQKKAVNSSYLTATKYLEKHDRIKLFELVSAKKLIGVVLSLPFSKPAIMNTQLFFDAINPDQENYWHRDAQYHLSIGAEYRSLISDSSRIDRRLLR